MKVTLVLVFTLIFSSFSQAQDSLDSVFSQKAGATDAEMKAAKEFTHQGVKDEAIKKGCENNEASKNCTQNVDEVGAVLGGTFGQALENNIGKLYGVLMGAGFLTGQGMPKVKVHTEKSKQLAKDQNVDPKKTAEEKADYCVVAAVGYELLSTHIQKSMQDKIERDLANDPELQNDHQRKALIALRKTHEVRQKTASYQRAIYAATSACYIARAAASPAASGTQIVFKDWKYLAKLSASIGLTGLYWAKVQKHKKAAAAVDVVINSLPGAGKCNPWTDTKCFCAAPSSKEMYAEQYQEVCVLNKGNASTPKVALGCGTMTGGQVSFDKECKCKATNTCLKSNLKNINPTFKLGSNFMSAANTGFDPLGSGNFDEGQFDAYAFQTGVNAAKVKNIATAPNVPKVTLTPEEKKIADSLKDIMPENMAALVAKAPQTTPPGAGISDGGADAALAKLSPELKEKVAATEPLRYKSGGAGFDSGSSQPDETFTMPSMGGETPQDSGTEVLSFAEEAVSQADVTKAPETPIFDIISNRYKRSGWTKLQAEEIK